MNDETKIKVFTDEDLNNISGGTDNNGQRISGIPCPICQGFIPISMYQLMSEGAIFCPQCGAKLDINKQQSAKALEILKRLQEQQS
ncbi:MAG: hypothetical protein KBT19_07840 [Lachnospiraceae bacterium]|nr:hypothetical protein [Candidatus Colinaster equi]